MTFNKCSIRGKLYGYVTDESGNESQDTEVITNRLFFFLLINLLYLEIKTT